MKRPVIGISGPDRGGFPAWFFASWAVRLSGGRPIRITPRRGLPLHKQLDGVILGGGADIEPSRYGAGHDAPEVRDQLRRRGSDPVLRILLGFALAPFVYVLRRAFSVKTRGIDPARDELELALIRSSVANGRPLLGICRGAQLLNVHFGGTLHRDVNSLYVEEANPWTVFPRKVVRIEPESRLADCLGTRRCTVNSLHRQAVDGLGEACRAVAREPNDVIQGIEHAWLPFCIGVQWHPEYLPQRPEQRRLFRVLVQAARSYADQRED